MSQFNSDSVSTHCLPSDHTTRFNSNTVNLDLSPEVQEQQEKMTEILPQAFQHQYLPHNHYQQHQQSVHCRQSASPFQYRAHAPASPSPLGLRNANAQSTIFSTMNTRETTEDNNNSFKFEGSPGQENSSFSSPIGSNQSNNSHKIFSFSPANNTTVTPPSKQSTFEARFRKSGGSNNPFTKIFGSPSPSSSVGSSSTSASTASKHRQLFLNKVKQNRDNARFNSRGETLMMMEYHSEQQSWDDRMRRKADIMYHQDYLLEDDDDDINNNNNNTAYTGQNWEMPIADPEESALEQFLMQEERDMDAALSEIPSPTSRSVRSDRSSFCGDDGDYDDIFMELVDNDEYHQSQDAAMSF